MATKRPKTTKAAQFMFRGGHLVISVLFVACGVILIGIGCLELWAGVAPGDLELNSRMHTVMGALAVLTVALAALELGQTVLEEEVLREAQMSAPTRVRRFLSRFMVVLVVALSIETLVLVFRFSHETPENLPYAAVVGIATAALLVAWGAFVRMNRAAEELEPEGLHDATKEDEKLKK